MVVQGGGAVSHERRTPIGPDRRNNAGELSGLHLFFPTPAPRKGATPPTFSFYCFITLELRVE